MYMNKTLDGQKITHISVSGSGYHKDFIEVTTDDDTVYRLKTEELLVILSEVIFEVVPPTRKYPYLKFDHLGFEDLTG